MANIKDKNMDNKTLCDELTLRVKLGKIAPVDVHPLYEAISAQLATSQTRHHDRSQLFEKNLRCAAISIFIALVFFLLCIVAWTCANHKIGLIVQGLGILCLTALLFGLIRVLDRLIDRH